ncbi:MAG: penicillin-binding protein 1C, partial [Gammaproteobacteria bacterium]|nr:penicillin-binding protein 1C [Gammaproteobacteria bacterium]
RFYQELKALGLSTLFRPADDYGLTLILGGAETSLWDMAQAYAQLAAITINNNSIPVYQPLSIIQNKAAQSRSQTKSDFGEGAAWLTLQAMMEVNRPGVDNYWREFSSSRKVAWKTGTSFGLRDAWAIAVTPDYTIAVWAGNASGEGVAGLSGTQSAAPLLFSVLNLLPDSGWFTEPEFDLRTIEICADDGYLLQQGCTAKPIKLPRNSHFAQVSNWHKQLYLSTSGNHRVHSGCEIDKNMRAVSLLQLPPGMAHYYRRWNPHYRDLPPWRKDCLVLEDANTVMEFLYPEQGAEIFLPVDIDGKQKPLISEAVHSEAGSSLHWHLDNNYLARTRDFHQLAFIAMPGKHVLTIVDDRGRKTTRTFSVIARTN